MSKSRNEFTLSDEYLRDKDLKRCSEVLNRMEVCEVRVLMYIHQSLNGNHDIYTLYDKEDVYNFLLIELAKYGIDAEFRLDLLIEKKANYAVSLNYFNWALNDLRSVMHLGLEILNSNILIPALHKDDYLNFIKLIIRVNNLFLIDDKQFKFNKINFYDNQNYYHSSLNIIEYRSCYSQKVIKDKSIKWIDKDNKEQIDFIFSYLMDLNRIVLLDVFIPRNYEEKYAQVLVSIDCLPDLSTKECSIYPMVHRHGNLVGISVKNVREYYVNSMKNAWNGRVHRKGKLVERSECQVNITRGNFVKLGELSELYDTSPNKLINKWIAKEYKKLDKDS